MIHITSIMEKDKGYLVAELASILNITLTSTLSRLKRSQSKQLVDQIIVDRRTYWNITEMGLKFAINLRQSD